MSLKPLKATVALREICDNGPYQKFINFPPYCQQAVHLLKHYRSIPLRIVQNSRYREETMLNSITSDKVRNLMFLVIVCSSFFMGVLKDKYHCVACIIVNACTCRYLLPLGLLSVQTLFFTMEIYTLFSSLH